MASTGQGPKLVSVCLRQGWAAWLWMWGHGDFCHKATGLLRNVETHINSMGTQGNSNCRPSGGVGGGRGEGLDGTDQVGFGVGREGMSMPRGTPAGTGSRGGEGRQSTYPPTYSPTNPSKYVLPPTYVSTYLLEY